MKAYQLTGLYEMELREVPDPQMERPDQVLIKLGAVGVCGSDVHYYAEGRIGSQVVKYPFTVGHECAGVVVQVGSGVRGLRPGDRVAIEPAMTCGQCDQCLAGRENTCRYNRFLGCPEQAEGCLSEYLVMPQQNCFPIGQDVGLAEATISEPLAIGIYAVRRSGLSPGAQIGILGMGPIGRAVLLPAMQLAGVAASYCTDIVDARCEAAERAGAAWVGNPEREDVAAEILKRAPLGLDVVFECCGQQQALDQAIKLLRPGGKLVIIGIPSADQIHFAPEDLRRNEISIINIRRQAHSVPSALDLIQQCPAEIAALITHRFPFAETPAAFDLVANYRDGVMKAIIEFDVG